MNWKSISFTALMAIVVFLIYAQAREKTNKNFSYEISTYIDIRDGKSYKIITFTQMHQDREIKRTWFAENLKFNVEGSKTYNNMDDYVDTFGRLYNYEQANLVCPVGWHVPTIYEWKHLLDFFKMAQIRSIPH